MKKKSLHKFYQWCVFIIYIIFLVYFMFFAEAWGRMNYSVTYRYNMQPFKEILRFINNWDTLGTFVVIANVFGNILAFLPLGFFLPMLTEHRMKFLRVIILSIGLSMMIELIQLITRVGSCDVDDVILNTLGGFVGYILFCIYKGIRKSIGKNKKG